MRPAGAPAGTATDAEIIGRSVADPERFAELFDRHAGRIHGYLARRLGRDAAADLVGETFLVAFGRRNGYDPAYADARPWLYGIATNLVAAHRRDEVRRYRLRLALPPESTVDSPVLLLVAWEQFSYEEVAAALDIPVGTVRSRLNRARRQVRAALGGTDPTDIEEQ
jgi:DNA-directed RNA polymerase specialized sigma24 family protein